ncbi:MAG: uroporphyrinogen decarboxylase family protein [Spirochaetia bacterium]
MNLYQNEKNNSNIWKAQHLQPVDRVPVHFSDQLDFLGGWLGLDKRMYHLDPGVTLDAQVRFNKSFDGTGILGPNYGVALETSAFGARIIFTQENPPWVATACTDYEDLKDYVANLGDPDPLFSGYLPLLYQSYFSMRKATGGAIAPSLGVIASIDVATLLVGMENLCIAIKLIPDTVHKLLAKINRFLINFIETKARLFDVTAVGVLDLYGDNAAYLSRSDFMEFVAPYNKAVYNYFRDERTVCLYHSDGNLSHLIDAIPEMGANCLYSFDPHTDLQKFVEVIGDRVCLMGNIDPIRVMRNGTVEEVKNSIRGILEVGRKAKGFVLSTGGELANGTPPGNICAALEAAELYGE